MTIRKYAFKTLLSMAAQATVCIAAFANDSSYGEDNGTIVFKEQPDISMEKELLSISETEIRVDYVFKNTGSAESIIPIAFPMPPMYFGQSDHSEIKDFKLFVDGVQAKTKRRLVVLLEGKTDITGKIASLGWSEKNLLTFLQTNEWPKGKKHLPADWFSASDEPLFTLNEYFVWQQAFPPGKAVSIRHVYTPSVSTGVPQPAADLIKTYAKDTCMDNAGQAALKRRDREYGIEWAHVSYILLTANNWQGPIKDFTLRIKKQSSTDLVSLCFDEGLRKLDPLTFEFHQENYRPTRDLSILFTRKGATD